MGPCPAVSKEGNNPSHDVEVVVDLASGDHFGEVFDFLPHDLLGDAFIIVLVGAGALDGRRRQELGHVEGSLITLTCIKGGKRVPSCDELEVEGQL